MLTVDKILLILSTDDWFIPSKSEDKITIIMGRKPTTLVVG